MVLGKRRRRNTEQSLRLWQSLRPSVSSSVEKVLQPLVQTRGGRCPVYPCSHMSVARRTLHVGEHVLLKPRLRGDASGRRVSLLFFV